MRTLTPAPLGGGEVVVAVAAAVVAVAAVCLRLRGLAGRVVAGPANLRLRVARPRWGLGRALSPMHQRRTDLVPLVAPQGRRQGLRRLARRRRRWRCSGARPVRWQCLGLAAGETAGVRLLARGGRWGLGRW